MTTVKASDALDTFVTFAGAVLTRLPRNLSKQTMCSWYDAPHQLKLALAESLSSFKPSWLAGRDLFPVILGTEPNLYADKVDERGAITVSITDLPGCERDMSKPPSLAIRPGIVEVLTLVAEVPKDTLERDLKGMGLRYANNEEIDAFGKSHISYLLSAPFTDRESLIAPGSIIDVRWQNRGFPILSVQKRAAYPFDDTLVVKPGMRVDNGFKSWRPSDRILVARL